jgi:Ca-activated chloride channel homolog
VRVDAMVTDGRRPVTGLTAANFEVKDNGVVQQVTEVQYETLPLNVICALDVSSSVSGEPLARLKTALAALIDALADRDRAALLTFSGAVHLHSPLTNDRPRLRALSAQMTAGGTTSFYDAAFAGLALREADNGRTMLLLFSDADDTSSWLSARKLIAAARQADVVIYPVTIPVAAALPSGNQRFFQNDPDRVTDPAQRLLEALADDTGGRVFFARDDDSLTRTFLSVLAEFRQRYVLTYEPTGVAASGWHDLDVKLKGKSGQVRARRGYFATNPTPAPEPRKPH